MSGVVSLQRPEPDVSRAKHEIALERDGCAMVLWPIRDSEDVTIGRAADCTIVLDDELVSRRHALLRLHGDQLHVQDTSTNGTLADGVVLKGEAHRIALGRPVMIGQSRLVVRRAGTAGATPPAAGAAGNGLRQLASVDELKVAAANAEARSSAREQDVQTAQPARPPEAQPSAQVEAPNELRREIHRLLLEHLDMNAIDATRSDDPALRPRVLAALRRIVRMLESRLPTGLSPEALIGEMADEALGLGPLEHLLADPTVSEVMVIDAHTIYVEQGGRLSLSGARFTDEERVRAAIERIITPLGRRVDESSPLVDARLADGSRVNVVIRPLALRGSCITIRKFARTPITMDKLLEYRALSPQMARFLNRSIRAKKNVVIAGGTGSGKTTLLNVLSSAIPEHERIVTIEDAAELQLTQPHVVSLESRPANMEGKGEVSIRDLVKNALRMRPDRIVVGECRGGEALDMLQAMNTGHDGSLTTTHANSPPEALMRLETLCLMAGLSLPSRAIREQIAKSVHLLVQQTRLSDGARKITAVSELAGMGPDGNLRLRPIFEFVRGGMSSDGRVEGSFQATGYLPSFLPELLIQGLIAPGEPYL
jgi:pilus assembly protein CpaF